MSLEGVSWPGVIPSDPSTWRPAKPGGLPAVTRAEGLIGGLIRQMSLEALASEVPVDPQPALLRRPDPSQNTGRAWWVGAQIGDYLRHGNAVHLVTSRGVDGLPTSCMWLPAVRVAITDDSTAGLRYWLDGRLLPLADVVHVRRGADPMMPSRGVGVVEQHLVEFSKLGAMQRYERDQYVGSGVPSVAITAPNADLSQAAVDDAAKRWQEKYAERVPAVLPAGTVVTPLAWSPSDSQMVEAHQMSLQDVANMYGLDGSWLGAPTKGLTYKSIGPQFLGLVRETIDPITDDFEEVWGDAWLPWGQELRFAKNEILGDDMTTEMGWLRSGVEAGIVDVEEARSRLRLAPRARPAEDDQDGRELSAAEVAQKVYLAVVNGVLDREEARDLIRAAGAKLKERS